MSDNWKGWTMELKYIDCGKEGCKSCPHGPYWYGFKHKGDNKTACRYFGKKHPARAEAEAAAKDKKEAPPPPREAPHPYDDILHKATARPTLAAHILGLTWPCTLEEATTAMRRLSLQKHPGRGGSHREMSWINCAFSYIKSLLSKK